MKTVTKQIFQNLLLDGTRLCDMTVEDGIITDLSPAGSTLAVPEANAAQNASTKAAEIHDLSGKLILPGIVESHVHLDTTMTEGDPHPNESGTLFEGIEIWSERKKKLTAADVKERARRAIRQQVRFGVQYIRSHVDINLSLIHI